MSEKWKSFRNPYSVLNAPLPPHQPLKGYSQNDNIGVVFICFEDAEHEFKVEFAISTLFARNIGIKVYFFTAILRYSIFLLHVLYILILSLSFRHKLIRFSWYKLVGMIFNWFSSTFRKSMSSELCWGVGILQVWFSRNFRYAF